MNEINMFSNYPDVVSVEQLQEMLDIGRNSAYKLIQNKEIKSVRIGRNYKIPKIYVLEYIQKKAC